MASYGVMQLTTQGQALYAKAQSGTALNFTRMQIGSGQLAQGQDPTTLTALITPLMYVSINSITSSGNTAYTKGIFDNSTIAVTTYICELGLFAQDPTLGEILYAYANAGTQGDYIPPTASGPFSRQMQINAAIGNATNVTATIPAGSYLALSGGDMTGALILYENPIQPLEAAPKQYVDSNAIGSNIYAYKNIAGGL